MDHDPSRPEDDEDASSPGDDASDDTDPDIAAVRARNLAFYDAFEARDLDAMSSLWLHTHHATIVHPGWPIMSGWGSVAASWFSLFAGPQQLQFIVTDETIVVCGDAAWVTCNENLLDSEGTQTVAATNVFVREQDQWLMVHHHGSPVLRPSPVRDS